MVIINTSLVVDNYPLHKGGPTVFMDTIVNDIKFWDKFTQRKCLWVFKIKG